MCESINMDSIHAFDITWSTLADEEGSQRLGCSVFIDLIIYLVIWKWKLYALLIIHLGSNSLEKDKSMG